MARTKRKINPIIPPPAPELETAAAFHVAGYVRLSIEDSGKPGTDTIESQRELVLSYISQQEDMWLHDLYCDNGRTGTNFVEVTPPRPKSRNRRNMPMRKCKGLVFLLALLLCCTILPMSASAKADGSTAEGYENVTQTWTETAGDPLSGKSDFYTRDLLYDKATNKQFITVQGRGGSIFYIVIDYDAQVDEDEEKYMVYFLNQVDEADLSALVDMEDKAPAVCTCTDKCSPGEVDTSCEVCAVNMSECVGKEAPPEPEPVQEAIAPEPEEPAGKKNFGSVIIVLLMVLAGAGAACYLKFFKKKPDVSGSADLDDYDYGDEDGPEDEPWEAEDQEDSTE